MNAAEAAERLSLYGCRQSVLGVGRYGPDTPQHCADCAFRAWLGHMLVNNPNGLGSELVMLVPGGDNPATADTLLSMGEALGWIERTAYAPSNEQLFFGVGGVSGSELQATKAADVRGFHGQLHMYRIIDRDSVVDYIDNKMPAKARYRLGNRVKYAPAFIRQCCMPEMLKSRGVIVGWSRGLNMPRVSWSSDPKDEPECEQASYGESCNHRRFKPNPANPHSKLDCGPCTYHKRVPYAARAISPSAITRA